MDKNKGATNKKYNSDFEHLKGWKNNPDLGYYLSDTHWNHHVNTALYRVLSQFYGNIGVYEYLQRPLASNRDLFYGILLNEAYRLCHIVLNSAVPEAKMSELFDDAETLITRDWKIPAGHRPPQPNIVDRILSYHILGVVNAILSLANDQEDSIDRFLYNLSLYNEEGVTCYGKYQSFNTYYKQYEQFVVVGLTFSSALRPGYNYKEKDEHLRKTILWYKYIAEELEKKRVAAEKERKGEIDAETIYTTQPSSEELSKETSYQMKQYNDNSEYEKDTEDEEYENEDEGGVAPEACEYDTTYDFIFDPRVKPKEVKKALDIITTFDKCQHPFWFVFMKVLVHLQWIPTSTYTKDVLSWASLQYDLNWKTKKQLSFSDIGGDKRDMNREANEGKQKKIKDTDITLWNTISKTEFRDIEKYRKFALLLKKTFVHFIVDGLEVKESTDFNLGKPRDRVKFMKSPKNLINLGK